MIIGLLAIILLLPVLTEADSVTIVNPGFENPSLDDGKWQKGISGWTSTTPSVGVWDVQEGAFLYGLPEGENVAYTNYSSISQQLDYYLTANTLLTLQVDVGWYFLNPMPGYEVQLLAGGQVIASNSITPLIEREFVTVTVLYTVNDFDPLLGQQVGIRLRQTSNQQVLFDDIRLENDPAPVPEPSTLLLLGSGLVGLRYFMRKKRS